MAKFKINKYKFVFRKKVPIGTSYETVPEVDFRFGNKYTDELNQYQYHKYHVGNFFSDYLEFEQRYEKSTKLSESECNILLLRYIEDELKKFRADYKRYKKLEEKSLFEGWQEYGMKVNLRQYTFYKLAAKKHRKIVKELKKTPEYMWEQFYK